MDKKQVQRAWTFLFMLTCALFMTFMPVHAATVRDESDIIRTMNQAIVNGDLQVIITVDRTFSVDAKQAKQEAENYGLELLRLLKETALKKGKLVDTGFSYVITGGHTVTYKFDISPQYVKKVIVLTSEKNAYKQALKVLKNRAYDTMFYAEDGMYYDTIYLALQHHPEYNYNLMIWKRTDGTFGYRASPLLGAGDIKSKMTKTNAKANAIVKKIVTAGMDKKQKLEAIHDYLVRNCVYDEGVAGSGYDDAYTAYGCLVKNEAVCQGYAAAFNLLAQKAGVRSITVVGKAGGGSHAWNYVKDGSSYRYIDVTWDDPLPDRGSESEVLRKYFYLTESQMEADHVWDKTEHAKKYI